MQPHNEPLTAEPASHALQASLRRVRREWAKGAPLAEILESIVGVLEEHNPKMVCSILTLNPDGKQLCLASPARLPLEFYSAIENLLITGGPAGQPMVSLPKKSLMVEAIWEHPCWEKYKASLIAAGIGACYLQPILAANEEPLGVLAVYCQTRQAFLPAQIELLATSAEIAGMAIEAQRDGEALKITEAKWRQLAGFRMISLLFWNLAGDIADANDTFLNLIGYTRPEMEAGQLRWRDITPPEYYESDQDVIRRMLAGEVVQHYIKQFIHKDGHRIDILLGLEMVAGSRTDAICCIQDITPQRKAENALQQQQHLTETIMENTAAGLIFVDHDGKISYVNSAAQALFGYSQQELLGQNPHDLLHHTHPDGTPFPRDECQLAQRLLASESIKDLKETFVCKNGAFLPILIAATPVYENGEMKGSVYEVQDLTERASAQAKLEASNKMLSMITLTQSLFFSNEYIYDLFEVPLQQLLDLTESSYGFIGEILHTAEGSPYLKCFHLTNIGWNEETRRLWEANRKTGFEFHPVDNLFGKAILTEELVISNDPDHDPRRAPAGRPHGHPPLNAFLGIPLKKNGVMIGLIGLANKPQGYDLALVEQLEPFVNACSNIIQAYRIQRDREKLTQDLIISEQETRSYAARLERSNKELEDFATIASHDLQAPLRKIITFSDMLRSSLEGQLSEQSEDFIARIQRGTGRMQSLIADLLALSRITRQGNPFQPTDLQQVMAQVLEDMDLQSAEAKATIEIGPLATIDADANQLRQVFNNLIGNALKFTRPGVLPHIKIHATVAGGWCEIAVQDNGIGFNPEMNEKIFKVFERLHAESTYPGTGIGLTIVRKIVERHHGMIQANGIPGEGAIFSLRLPLKQECTN
jgi:PAS domain S-box-containing protein